MNFDEHIRRKQHEDTRNERFSFRRWRENRQISSSFFRWYKYIEGTTRRQPIQLDDRVRQVSGTLIIREARVEDSGKYLCIVNNSVGGESVETVLTVTAPLTAEIEPSTQTIDFGRPATFTCTVQGNPIKTISWLKDGKPLGLEDRVLRIESVKKEDKGMYQCFVRNDQESAQATAELKLGGRCELIVAVDSTRIFSKRLVVTSNFI